MFLKCFLKAVGIVKPGVCRVLPGFLRLLLSKMSVCVSLPPRALITTHMKWTCNNWLNMLWCFLIFYMALAINIMDRHSLSNTKYVVNISQRRQKQCYILVVHFIVGDAIIVVWELQCIELSGYTVHLVKHLKTRLGSSFTVRILEFYF